MIDFVLMTPIYHGVDGITCWCVEKAHHARLNNFLWVPGCEGKGDALICRNRSVSATTFMECGEANHMIFLDSDIVFTPEDLKMISDDMQAGYDIVGGLYPTRSGTDWTTYFWEMQAPTAEMCEDNPVQEVQFLATGFMGISKYALQKIAKDYVYPDGRKFPILHPKTGVARSYPFFEAGWTHIDTPDADGSEDIWLSEDYDFCEKARAVGFKIYADMRVQLGHQGTRIVTTHTVEMYRALQEKRAEDVKQKGDSIKREEGAYTDFVADSTGDTE
ncbi:hypothetical protein LCGC14_0931280 [marine sediment metagenome]|uniref:Glycosyltransferase 2-like domain-containing protein n=1 Tax=marine sediment metagenome TaxID=412755 RepID=A0A0F9R6F3_9ZZZZ